MSRPVSAFPALGSSSTKRHFESRDIPMYSGCGRVLIDPSASVDASSVRAEDRCRQSGCVAGWRSIGQGVTS